MKRQKHVFDTARVPHLWAHKTQDSARNRQGNLYFEGDTIYSYGSHFPIARHVQNEDGPSAVLLTIQSYSVTTSGHISGVRCAIPHGTKIFHVSNPSSTQYAGLRDDYVRRMTALADSAKTRKMETTRSEDVEAAENLRAECAEFCRFFDLKFPEWPELPKIDQEKLARQRQAVQDRQYARDAERKAKWEAAVARDKAEADRWNASGFCKHEPKHDAHIYGARWRCEHQTEQEEFEAHKEEYAQKWREGETVPYSYSYRMPTMLRVKGDEVETSRGAAVPVLHAIRGLKFVRNVIAGGAPYVSNGHLFRLGHYVIDRVDVDGTLRAGCHVIPYSEIERIAPELEKREVAEQ